jgi:hypothetical protein
MKKMLILLVSVLLAGCGRTATPATTSDQTQLRLYPPIHKLNANWESANALAKELRANWAFGIVIDTMSDFYTEKASHNLCGLDQDGKVFHLDEWPHKVALGDWGTVYVFRAPSYNHPFQILWSAGPKPDDQATTTVVAGSVIQLNFVVPTYGRGWGSDLMGYTTKWGEGVHILQLIPDASPNDPSTFQTIKVTPENQPEPAPPWGKWQSTEHSFNIPASTWAGADPDYLPKKEH